MDEKTVVKEDVNKVIKGKIEDLEVNNVTKKFLYALLSEELVHINEMEAWHGWKSCYEALIRKNTKVDEGESQ